MRLGLLLMLAALGLTVYNMQQELQAGKSSAAVISQMIAQQADQTDAPTGEGVAEPSTPPVQHPEAAPSPTPAPQELQITAAPDYIRFPGMEMPTAEMNGERYIGKLQIPALGLTLPVMSEWSYPRLKKAPCRFSGSAYTGDLIVIAHNYASHFGKLKSLRPGATVCFTDMAGNTFYYAVAETEILRPDQIDDLKGTDYPLTLLTCTLGGESRVTVRCEKTMEIPAK